MNNVLWLVADNPNSFAGQCAELCGIEHANMKFVIIADSPEDFAKWEQEQRATLNATPPPTPTPAATVAASPTPTAAASATPTPTGS
jgi:cytochrome c oxidase subunit 2